MPGRYGYEKHIEEDWWVRARPDVFSWGTHSASRGPAHIFYPWAARVLLWGSSVLCHSPSNAWISLVSSPWSMGSHSPLVIGSPKSKAPGCKTVQGVQSCGPKPLWSNTHRP